MLLDVPCKQGKFQVLEEGILRVMAPFNKLVWQIPCANVTKFTTQSGPMMTVTVTIYTTQGTHLVEMVTKQNFEKLQAIFPHLQTISVQGQQWYHDLKALTHIVTYTDEKTMQREVEAAAQHGWMPQGTTAIGSHINVGRTVTAAALSGGVSLLFGASRSKKEITITFVRTSEWLAQNK